jgi:NAD(P)-dependent dehydrogenase (short-subunit alcohol dehydrogenase family)
MAVALITGASRGFGRAVARSLALDGWSLVLDARGAPALELVTAELAQRTDVRGIAGDVTDAWHRERLVAEADALGGLDLLVNNASGLGPSPQPTLAAYPLDVLRSVYEVNVVAPLALVQTALPLLRASHGTIVNVTSDAAREPYEGWGGYGSSKAALEQWGNILGAEEPDVRVYTFDPGDMRTQMHQEAFPGEDISDRPEPELVVPPLRRLLSERPVSGRFSASELVR